MFFVLAESKSSAIFDMGVAIYRIRILSVHFVYVLYSAILWWRLINIGKITDHPESQTKLAFGAWLAPFLVVNFLVCYSALSKSPNALLQRTWCNIPMLVLIGFNLPPFGFTLKHLYEATEVENARLQAHFNQTCVKLKEVPMSDFILLQMVMPILLATFITYPLPRRGYTSSEYLGIAVEFMNAFDIMDMIADVSFVEKYGTKWVVLFYLSLGMSAMLVAFPIKIENEDFVWQRQFVICAHSELTLNHGNSMSSILTAPYVIETETSMHRRISISPMVDTGEETNEQSVEKNDIDTSVSTFHVEESVEKNNLKIEYKHTKEDHADSDPSQKKVKSILKTKEREKRVQKKSENYFTREVWRKLVKAMLTMIFMDIFFACIRFKIMVTEESAEYGFNMFVKNVILSALHLSYLLQHVRSIIVSKLMLDIDK